MSTITVAGQFTLSNGQPATGLTLSEIDITLIAIAKSTGIETAVWNTQNPSDELTNIGVYKKEYTSADLDANTYYAMFQYTGATALDSDYIFGSAGEDKPANYALVDIGLDHLLSTSVSGGDIIDDSIIAQLVSASATADWDTFNNTTDSLEVIGTNTGSISSSGVADAVWDEPLSGHTTPGSAGAALDSGTMADAIWDEVMEAGAPAIAQTARQWMRLMAAALFGEDAETGDWSAKSVDGSTTRIAATLTTAGKRSSVSTLDGS